MKKTPNKKNDRTIFIVAVILFALSVGLFVGAYARFQTQVTGTGKLETATWAFTVNGQTSEIDVDLASQSTIHNTVPVVVDGETINKIQPGSYGYFDLTLSAAGSDVDVYYNVSFGDVDGKPANLALYSDSSYSQDLSSITNAKIDAGETATVTIYWKWLYSATSVENDYAGQTLTLPITITGYQNNPGA